MGRLIVLTFFSKPRMSHEVEHHIHESPRSMTVPLVILAFFSVVAGWFGLPHSLGGSDRFGKFLEPVFARDVRAFQEEKPKQLAAGEKEEEHTDPMEYGLMGLSVAAAFVGLGFAWKAYSNAGKDYKEPIDAVAPPVYNVLLNKYYVDEGYDYVFTGRRKIDGFRLGVFGLGDASAWFDTHVIDGIVNGAGRLTRLSGTISSWWDKWIIDGVLVNGPAILARVFSYPLRMLQWGLVQWYALVMTVGLVGFMAYYVWH